ncbi:amino acid ABC transporter substrate-binding protein [Marinomonas sp. CT5]|uniref:substrate-binding periplasmic protein n=1 Tax=Marinomonas sp. CT5 TaxID=2066133 RepID=UPI001BB0CAF5|nr:ABC transporter substrate-binding protein [Marinomonas sp. CT5]QUX93881.1 amino acid ABC transporter substrate-binding protein [Marinomonas sp. CT5]
MSMKKLILSAILGLSMSSLVIADTIDVGITTTGIPFTYLDMKTQKPAGAMVDLANAIITSMGDEAQFKITSFSALIPSLETGKIDLISAGMFATAERQKVVNFTDIVYSYGDGLFVAADDDETKSLDDLKGQKVGAQIGTVFPTLLEKHGGFSEIKLYDSLSDIMRDIKLGRIKAGLGDAPVIGFQVSKNPRLGVKLVKDYKAIKVNNVALAVSKGNPKLLEKVNIAIEKLKKNGKLDAIFTKYGL